MLRPQRCLSGGESAGVPPQSGPRIVPWNSRLLRLFDGSLSGHLAAPSDASRYIEIAAPFPSALLWLCCPLAN
jgi:hypothetical protein